MNINLNISPLKILMILFLLMLSNGSLIKHNNFTQVIENNNIVKHITIIITIAVIISLLYNGIPLIELIFYSFILYIIYVLSIKLDKKYVLLFGITLSLLYFIDYYNRHNINLIKNDKNIQSKKKDKIIEEINKKNIYLFGGFVIIVIAGSLTYDNKKHTQYGSGYSMTKFLNL